MSIFKKKQLASKVKPKPLPCWQIITQPLSMTGQFQTIVYRRVWGWGCYYLEKFDSNEAKSLEEATEWANGWGVRFADCVSYVKENTKIVETEC